MSPQTICLLLTPANDPDTPSVRSRLSAHQWHVSAIHEPFRAIAELALRERAQAARLGWGLGRGQKIALVIHQPATWRDADRLIAAVRRHLPSVEIWTAEQNEFLAITNAPTEPGADQSDAEWSAMSPGDFSAPRASSSTAPHPENTQPTVPDSPPPRAPDLRLTDDSLPGEGKHHPIENMPEQPAPAEPPEPDEQQHGASPLTADEIEMLLTDTPNRSTNHNEHI